MISLFENERYETDRQSSKGNQLKFYRNGIWYKADYLGYEALAEYTIAKLMGFSDLGKNEFADYDLEQIEYNEIVFNACKSRDFSNGWNLITLERLFKNIYGKGLNYTVRSLSDHEERLKVLVDQVERVTGIEEFGKYMNKMLTVDALFLNEDRHTHNIAVLTNEKNEFKLAPIFDNGAALLSDTTLEYPMTMDHITLIDRVKPKTFCEDFTEQLEISEKLYGGNLHFSFDYMDIRKIVDKADIYDIKIRDRVVDVVMQMRRKYEYLFG